MCRPTIVLLPRHFPRLPETLHPPLRHDVLVCWDVRRRCWKGQQEGQQEAGLHRAQSASKETRRSSALEYPCNPTARPPLHAQDRAARNLFKMDRVFAFRIFVSFSGGFAFSGGSFLSAGSGPRPPPARTACSALSGLRATVSAAVERGFEAESRVWQ